MERKRGTSLAERTVTSASWNIVASLTKVVVLFIRSVLLARWLPVEAFGVYALANSITALTAPLPNFGMESAFLHRAPETQDESHAAAIHFTLKTLFTLAWASALAIGTLILVKGEDRAVMLAIIAVRAGIQLTQTPQLILTRRVIHRRLALIQLLKAILSTVVALGIARYRATVWALVATDLVTFALTFVALYVWHPVWRPRMVWDRAGTRYFLSFGSRAFLSTLLARALDRTDDLWTGLFLGKTPLSFYSRAYRFANYPRTILAAPLNTVAGGTYAELKGNRAGLSRAFFRVNAFLVRSGFLLAGLLALIAPEFIRLLLGEKWLPMLDAFRFMLVYTLFDPIKGTIGKLFVAVGKPELVVMARSIQLAVMVAGLFLLGLPFGITGVALAVDLMLVVGIAILLWQARVYVDFSVIRLFAAPTVALLVGLALSLAAMELPGVIGSDWRTGAVKAGVFSIAYGMLLLIFEHHYFLEMATLVRGRLPVRPKR